MSSAPIQPSSFTQPQKAAILVMYLDPEISKRVLSRLSDDEIRLMGMAMATVDRVTPVEIETVVSEFLKDLTDTATVNHSGPDFVKQVLPELIEDERQEPIMSVINRRVNREFENFIRNRKPGAVAALLKDEQCGALRHRGV